MYLDVTVHAIADYYRRVAVRLLGLEEWQSSADSHSESEADLGYVS